MNDYQPLDLSALCNSGLDAVSGDARTPVGEQFFRGLPFKVGPPSSSANVNRFILLDGSSPEVKVTVGQSAHRVIFAHSLLESDVPEGGELGLVIAEYVFTLADGRVETVSIRERYEIGFLPGGDGIDRAMVQMAGVPFRAVTDTLDTLPARHEGQWEETGRRQMEGAQGAPRAYFLWAWTNPTPQTAIESVTIVPKRQRFIVAGVTLGHVDEHPFARQGRREAVVELTRPEDAAKPFDLTVEVDRGTATFAQPLPETAARGFVDAPFKGWGEPLNTTSGPAYVEIAATPSATVTVKQGGEEVGSVRWGDVEEKGEASTPRMRVGLLDRGRNWVNVTVVDDDTGRPVPCRVHFRSPEGVPYQPHGHHNQVNSNLGTWHIDVGGDVRLGQITYAYIDGKCQGWLPRGEVVVDVARGYEYEPLRARVNIEPGQRELTLRLKRWINMNERRWYSGDSHVHFLSTQSSHTEALGEDLNVVNLLQSQWGSLFTNTEEFTGNPNVSRDGSTIVYVSQENRQHFMGHMILWGLKEPVMPWCSDGLGEGEMGGTMETTLSRWADACHGQGGTVVLPHFPNPNGEPATLVATGRVDAVEMIRHSRFNHIEYYRYLNCGYRLPLVGGTDKMSNEVPVGMYRTYAYLAEDEFNYENWCKAVASGRTFLSGGPIVHFSVEGRQVGDTVRLSGPGTVEVEAWAESILPIHKLEIVQEGRVVASAESVNGTRRLELKEKIRVDANSWLTARCGGPSYYDALPHYDVWNRGLFAHTSPIYVACGGEWGMFDESAARYMLTLIDGSLTYIRETATHHAPGSVTHHHGEDDHQAFLERPFLDAQEAMRRRLESKA